MLTRKDTKEALELLRSYQNMLEIHFTEHENQDKCEELIQKLESTLQEMHLEEIRVGLEAYFNEQLEYEPDPLLNASKDELNEEIQHEAKRLWRERGLSKTAVIKADASFSIYRDDYCEIVRKLKLNLTLES